MKCLRREKSMQKETEMMKNVPTRKDNRPMEVIRAVLLTSSGKNGAACVAAYDLNSKQFVRFVSDASTAAAIPFEEIRGLSAFDIVEVDALQKCPVGPQTENVYVKPFGFHRVGNYSGTIEDIRKEIRYPDRRSLAFWEKNRIFNVSGYQHSLEIISVRDLVLKKTAKSSGGLTTRADFIYRDKLHKDYRVTDFDYDLREREEGEIRIPYADLVLSIPKEEYIKEGYSLGYFKFVAAIFPIDPPEEKGQPLVQNLSADSGQPQYGAWPRGKEKAYEPWTEEEEKRLLEEYEAGISLPGIAEMHARTRGAIQSRLKKLGRIQ